MIDLRFIAMFCLILLKMQFVKLISEVQLKSNFGIVI